LDWLIAIRQWRSGAILRKLARFSNGRLPWIKSFSVYWFALSAKPRSNMTKQELVCRASGLAYPIREGIPVMLESDARQLNADEKLRDSAK
jgi:uncharacterized protein YbaR (Trm112 family)